MINNILRKFGYVQRRELTREDISRFIINSEDISGIWEDGFTQKEENIMFKELSTIEGFSTYLSNTMASDMKRYFKAESPAQQLEIRGAFYRSYYLKQRVKTSDSKTVKKAKSVLPQKRYL